MCANVVTTTETSWFIFRREEDIWLCYKDIETGCEAHLTSCSLGNGEYFPRAKKPELWAMFLVTRMPLWLLQEQVSYLCFNQLEYKSTVTWNKLISCSIRNLIYRIHYFFDHGATVPVGQDLIIENSWSHSDTPHSVGLLWTSDQPDAAISTWQHTTLTTDKHLCPRRGSNPTIPESKRPQTHALDCAATWIGIQYLAWQKIFVRFIWT
jgi:hypothetical protein